MHAVERTGAAAAQAKAVRPDASTASTYDGKSDPNERFAAASNTSRASCDEDAAAAMSGVRPPRKSSRRGSWPSSYASVISVGTPTPDRLPTCVEIKFYGAFVLNLRVDLHAIDATPAR